MGNGWNQSKKPNPWDPKTAQDAYKRRQKPEEFRKAVEKRESLLDRTIRKGKDKKG
jgi:hypothetical protein